MVEVFTRLPTSTSPDALTERVDRAGEILRVLSHVIEPLRTKGIILHPEPSSQERLAKAICETFTGIESTLAAGTASAPHRFTHNVVFLARLLQFNLGLGGS